MTALRGFDKTTGDYLFAVETTDPAQLALRRSMYSSAALVEQPSLPPYPSLYRLENGVAVQVADYAEQVAAIDAAASEPPPPTYRTLLNKTEYRSLFTPLERVMTDKARALIEGDLSFLTVIPDDQAPGMPVGITYRDSLRTLFAEYNDAPDIDMAGANAIEGHKLLRVVGIFASDERRDTVTLGLPI